jgi:hypothetical protein
VQAHGSVALRCNIGPEELARRRRSAVVLTIVAAVVAVGLVVLHVQGLGRLLLFWPVAAGAAITWLQVVHRFCVAFGALGLENFGRLGAESAVDPSIRAADRRRALQLVAEGAVIGLVAALVLVALPA